MVANLLVEEWHSVHQRLRGLAKRHAQLDAEEARCLRDAERVQLWRRVGYVHMGEYLERELGYGPHAGAERMRVARALGELPQIEAALGEGVLLYSVVRELSRVATCDTEAEWLASARGKNLRQVEASVAGRKRGDRPGDPTTPELVNRVVRLELSPDVFALFRQVQAALADEHGGRLDDNAFIQALCRRALEGPGTDEHARPAHQISIMVCGSCKRGWQNGAGREIEVGPEVIERAQCDAEHLGSLEAAQPARVTTTVTPRARRQVLTRDHHCCTVPGCRSARNLDLHHIEFQSHGGDHQLWNITSLCTGHHQQLHEGALTIRGRAPDDLEFTWRAPAAPAIEQAQSPRGPAIVPRTPRIEASIEHGEAPIEHGRSPRGPVTLPAPGIEAAIEHGQSPRGPAIVPRTPRIEASIEHGEAPIEHGRSPRGPVTLPAPGIEAAIEHGQSPRGPAIVPRVPVEHGAPCGVSAAPAPSIDYDIIAREVRDALTTAGYKPHEARRAVEQALATAGPEATLERLLREALRCCQPSRYA